MTLNEFLRQVMVGACPKCGSENTDDCENDLVIDDITIGHCFDCGTYWCLECGYIFRPGEERQECPHWGICHECSTQNEYMSEDAFFTKICPTCEDYSEEDGCQLADLSLCEKRKQFCCPYVDFSECPKLAESLGALGKSRSIYQILKNIKSFLVELAQKQWKPPQKEGGK